MIKGLGVTTVWCFDQDRAKAFFIEKLGLEERADLTMGEGGMRWVSVGAKDQPELQLTLMVPGPPTMDPDSAEHLRALMAKGVLGAGAFTTDDCHGDYRTFAGRGVQFIQDPQNRPYGIEAIFRDDDGNWYSLTQPHDRLDEAADWHR